MLLFWEALTSESRLLSMAVVDLVGDAGEEALDWTWVWVGDAD